MPDLHPAAREVVEIIAVASIVLATLYKLASLYANTRKWNGLGKALRDEKWVYVAAWSWLILHDYIGVLNHGAVTLLLATAVVISEIRVALYIPRVTVRHDAPRDS